MSTNNRQGKRVKTNIRLPEIPTEVQLLVIVSVLRKRLSIEAISDLLHVPVKTIHGWCNGSNARLTKMLRQRSIKLEGMTDTELKAVIGPIEKELILDVVKNYIAKVNIVKTYRHECFL